MKLLTTEQKLERYGRPDQSGPYLRRLITPYPLYLSWDLKTRVTTISCHSKEVVRLEKIMTGILDHYGLAKIHELKIDVFGGCFNFRQQRGGNDWSSHAWAIACDFDPDRNQLKWGRDKAEFAKPEYAKMIDIYQDHGWASLGREKNYDWMHFEAT